MPDLQQLRQRLLKKLPELFQLDQPDLDFGFYRIMHAKSAEVQDFITTDLLSIVADAFGVVDEARKAELKAKIDKDYPITIPSGRVVNPPDGRCWEGLQGIEGDNLMLDEWFQKMRISTRDFEFDTIYVNGSNNLPNLALADENWKVRLIEEEFMKRMWDGEGV